MRRGEWVCPRPMCWHLGAQTPDCPQRLTDDNNTVVLQPGKTAVRFAVWNFVVPSCRPTWRCRPGLSAAVPRRAQSTRVWLVAPSGIEVGRPQPVTITDRSGHPPVCRTDLVVPTDEGTSDVGISPYGGEVHRVVLRNGGKHACQIDGAPAINGLSSAGWLHPPERRAVSGRVILRPGRTASFLILITQPPCVSLGQARQGTIRLPDQGQTPVFPANPTVGSSCESVSALTNVVAGSHAGASLMHR